MEKEAVKLIQESAHIPAIMDAVANLKTKAPLAVTPESMGISSLDQFMEFRSYFKQNYNTEVIADFVKYAKTFSKDGAVCACDVRKPTNMSAKVIFDIGTTENPEHKRHSAELGLVMTAGYRTLYDLAMSGGHKSQHEAIEFIEDWGHHMTGYDESGKPMTAGEMVASYRDMTVDKLKNRTSNIGQFTQNMSAAEKVEARSQGRTVGGITFDTVTYLGFQLRGFAIQPQLSVAGESVSLRFRVVKFEAELEEIAEEFADILRTCLEETKIETLIGRIE